MDSKLEPIRPHPSPLPLSTALSLAGLLVASWALPGCGYRTGLAPSIEPVLGPEAISGQGLGSEEFRAGKTARSIGIKIFGNESLLPNVERDLHAAFSSSARRHASMDLVSPSRADLYIQGRVAGFNRDPGARTVNNRAVETIEVFTIEAELVDGSTGRVVGRASVQPRMGTAIDVPGREPFIRERALSNAADRLLLLLLAGLEYGVTAPGDPLLPENAPAKDQPGAAATADLVQEPATD